MFEYHLTLDWKGNNRDQFLCDKFTQIVLINMTWNVSELILRNTEASSAASAGVSGYDTSVNFLFHFFCFAWK